MSLTAILARSTDNIIGTVGPNGPCLPWRLPPDLKRFKALTDGHAIIMGRTTFDSIGRRPLPRRRNIVVSRSVENGKVIAGAEWFCTPYEALCQALKTDPNPYLIGGAEMYEALWSEVDRVELTEVYTLVGLGRAFVFDEAPWGGHFHEDGEHEGLKYRFTTLFRVRHAERQTERQSTDGKGP